MLDTVLAAVRMNLGIIWGLGTWTETSDLPLAGGEPPRSSPLVIRNVEVIVPAPLTGCGTFSAELSAWHRSAQ